MPEMPEISKNAVFICENCEFKCVKKSNWLIHIKTNKHINNVHENQVETTKIKICDDYTCNCGKKYLTNSGLWKHTKICKFLDESKNTIIQNNNEIHNKDLIIMLIKENSEFKNMLMEQQNIMLDVIKNGITNNNMNNNNTTNITNSHNKAFNLNFFLNETCKNAMNITEFADSIKLQLSDFENVGDVGFITGISNIIIKKLKALDITQRPVHCTDQKREIIYIKDEDKWEKEDDKKQKFHKFLKKIINKNQRLILKFQEVYPDYNKYSSPNSTRYDKIVIEALGGRGDNNLEKEDKIISNISKTIGIDK
jgi:hypothetical protein